MQDRRKRNFEKNRKGELENDTGKKRQKKNAQWSEERGEGKSREKKPLKRRGTEASGE